MRIGLLALLHESNTFSRQPTTLDSFRQNLLLTGEPMRVALAEAHHEVGGFFAGLAEHGAEAVPLFAARALPSGTIGSGDFAALVEQLMDTVQQAGPLDGLLVAPHGATVSEDYPDADGHWLSQLRKLVGPHVPIIGTLDAHANLSPLMVDSCDALVAYRTNPHLDQRQRGIEAATLMVRTVRGEITPTMAAAFPPLAIGIERQCTEEPHLRPLYDAADRQLQTPGVLSNSILLGFPYADVAEMGSAVMVVTDNDKSRAQRLANDLAAQMWSMRNTLGGTYTSIAEALEQVRNGSSRVCLLDMGDNVGGGSAADGTELLGAIQAERVGPAFGCLYDPEAVQKCERAGIGSRLPLNVGGHTDAQHGAPLAVQVTVVSLHEGVFRESQPRHGGITEFDQGRTAVVVTDDGLTLMLTSRRMVPFSLCQLTSCGLDPRQFRILVAKGVNAPLAAYREVCDQFIRVNTMGSTCADMRRLTYHHRRRPLFPLEPDTSFSS
jgi:microcystin degradation protein MlrC